MGPKVRDDLKYIRRVPSHPVMWLPLGAIVLHEFAERPGRQPASR